MSEVVAGREAQFVHWTPFTPKVFQRSPDCVILGVLVVYRVFCTFKVSLIVQTDEKLGWLT